MSYGPSLKLKAAAELELRRRSKTFGDFIKEIRGDIVFYRHVQILVDTLQKVADGEILRLMIFCPPRHGKSEIVSRLFSAYYLYKNPDKFVGLTSYGATLAQKLSRDARENYRRSGGPVSDESFSVKEWHTGKGGGLWAAGVGGAITGSGFYLGIIDDPVKGAEDASSPTMQDKQKDWYSSVFYTRREPGAAIILVQTRWNKNDLAGHIIEKERSAPADKQEDWHVLHLPAIFEGGEALPEDTYPDHFTIIEDFRGEGQALCPERYDAHELENVREEIGDYFFSCLYQQLPYIREGGMFAADNIEVVKGVPANCNNFVRYIDKAGSTTKSASYTAAVLMAHHRGVYYIVDMVMFKREAVQRETLISSLFEADRKRWGAVYNYVEQEPGSGGKESAQSTIRENPGFIVKADKVTGSKEVRAEPLASQVGIGNVKMLKGEWNDVMLSCLRSFPGGIKDPVDAASGAFNMLAKMTGSRMTKQEANPFYS